jgi:hypothetical protein
MRPALLYQTVAGYRHCHAGKSRTRAGLVRA